NKTRPFLKIGMYQVGGQVINYFNRDLDILIIGKFFGAELLGGYSLAKQLVRRPLMIVDPIMTKVAVSIMPRFQDDIKLLLGYFSNLIKGMALVDAMIYGAMAICAPLLVQIFYGEAYNEIVPFVRILPTTVYFRVLGGIMGI